MEKVVPRLIEQDYVIISEHSFLAMRVAEKRILPWTQGWPAPALA